MNQTADSGNKKVRYANHSIPGFLYTYSLRLTVGKDKPKRAGFFLFSGVLFLSTASLQAFLKARAGAGPGRVSQARFSEFLF